ncbi:hypothetical protein MKX01_033501 [Papaver californicum]|nr:hypothetical protein MKX01_033501 [Papaver californicum]
MRIVGLTGGISSGKSTISNLFKSHGVPVIDADLIARDVLKKDTGGWKKVVAAFGHEILLDNTGEVSRPLLGQIGYGVIILDIPLLFEAKLDKWTKPIIVVWISEEQARNRINAQMELDWKREKADTVIDNSGSLVEIKLEFEKVLSQVMKPLTWTEFGFSRQGPISVFVSVVVGVCACRNFYNSANAR